MNDSTTHKHFVAFVKFIGWWCFSLGVHIDLKGPRLEIHFPTGWASIGWWDDSEIDSKWEDGLFGWD